MKKFKDQLKETNSIQEYVFDYILDLSENERNILSLLFKTAAITSQQYTKMLNFIHDENFFAADDEK